MESLAASPPAVNSCHQLVQKLSTVATYSRDASIACVRECLNILSSLQVQPHALTGQNTRVTGMLENRDPWTTVTITRWLPSINPTQVATDLHIAAVLPRVPLGLVQRTHEWPPRP